MRWFEIKSALDRQLCMEEAFGVICAEKILYYVFNYVSRVCTK